MVKIPVMGEVDEMPEQEMAAEAPGATADAVSDGAIWNPDAATSNLHLGIDVGSTTVKLAVLNDDNQIVYAKYQRHHTDVRACARDLFVQAAAVLPEAQMTCAITGSGACSCPSGSALSSCRRSSRANAPWRP